MKTNIKEEIKISNIQIIVEQLPLILQYFIPGYIFIYVFYFFTSKKSSQGQNTLLYAVIVSYFLKSIVDTTIFKNNTVFLCLCALVASIVTIQLSRRRILEKIFSKINHKAVFEDIWLNVLDYDEGTTLRFTCYDGSTIIGILMFHEEKENNSWFIISDYSIKNENEDFSSSRYSYSSKLAVNLKDVKRVEIFNTK